MQSPSKPSDLVVIGGGIIGLSIAWRAAQRGMRVAVLERGRPGGATSWVAAGMLAPISEAVLSERALLSLGLASAGCYPAFVEELESASGGPCGYLRCGTLLGARDADEAEALERELALRMKLGLPARRLRASEARALEPALAPTFRLALEIPDDHAIDPRSLTAALVKAVENAGGELRARTTGTAVSISDGRVLGVVADGELLLADHVVIAAGCWSGALRGIPDHARVPIHPVKGQILELRDPTGPGLLTRVLRMRRGYVVPRGDGRYVLGATMEERGFDTTVTAGACFELLRDAIELLPGLGELVLAGLSAGLRPVTPDNLPAIGESTVAGLHWAAGHYRHGVLLAPITAELVIAGLSSEEPASIEGVDRTAFSPARFSAVTAGV
ncbi:MAG: glycine oxidase ThiO [Actinomycetota bacterium]|nr:glycine oxidase ThiO [Actinomycetota bacterium]